MASVPLNDALLVASWLHCVNQLQYTQTHNHYLPKEQNDLCAEMETIDSCTLGFLLLHVHYFLACILVQITNITCERTLLPSRYHTL
jgi:hypothetical protein